MRQRGTLMIETAIGLILMLILVSSVFFILSTTYGSANNVTDVNAATAKVQAQIDTVADHIRNAQENGSDGNRAIASAQANEITYYTAGGTTVRYYLSGGNLHRAPSDGSDVVVLQGVSSLSFTYLLLDKYNFYQYTNPASAASLTDAERAKIGVVIISCSASVNGIARQFQTSIRLRNSPRKTSL